jgi:bacterioferritin-associated ferredoxin
MNKAFTREPEADTDVRCPRCDNIGVPVESGPLDRYCDPLVRPRLPSTAWCCRSESCPVAYFNPTGAIVRVDELRECPWPWNPQAPVCACFGVTYKDIVREADAGQPQRIRELVQQSKSPAARCREVAGDGQCCLTEVQRLYYRLKSRG